MCGMSAAARRFPANLFRRRIRRKERRAARLAADAARFERAAQRLEVALGSDEPWQVRPSQALRGGVQAHGRQRAARRLAASQALEQLPPGHARVGLAADRKSVGVGRHSGPHPGAEVALHSLLHLRRAAVGLEAVEVPARAGGRGPTGAARRAGRDRCRASRASPRTHPAAPLPRRRWRGTRARGCFDTTGKCRKTRRTGTSLEQRVGLRAVGALEVRVFDDEQAVLGTPDVVVRPGRRRAGARQSRALRQARVPPSASKIRFRAGDLERRGRGVRPLHVELRADHHEPAQVVTAFLDVGAVAARRPRPLGWKSASSGNEMPRCCRKALCEKRGVDRDSVEARAPAPRARPEPPDRRSGWSVQTGLQSSG